MPSNQKKLSGTEDDKTGFTFVVTTSASKQTAEDKKKVRSAAALSSWPERRKRIFEQVDERQAGQGKFYLDSPYGASQPSTTRKKARAEHTSSSTAVSQPAGDARDGSLNASFQLAPGVIQPLVRRSEYGSPPTQCTRPTSPKIPCNCPDAFKDWKGYAMSITAEEPPDKHRGASASPYRIDIVVDAYERGGLRRFTLLFLEIKRAAAGPSKCEEVEAQAYRACLMHTSAQTSYVFAMTAIGTSTRTWKYYQGNFVPMNGQSGRSDPQLYIDAADKGKGVALLGQLLQMIDLLGFDLAKKADLLVLQQLLLFSTLTFPDH
ncbi:hypothetical protein KC356_g9251 [Hortaea werneckii]|nr:hypothetical protein KC361_g9038 [Hortaea werneckii]KAI6815377.1 hypothetical protein KC342_g15970 [Hortaea werneckii]KAI6852260.1 hypothetical protein KC323_g9494 [Hortaea werneckii]KAI6858126.1 hypothetical protein KC338_g7817 [Hortaea werneckii]KAI7081233.1 hypothetical protein KC356_g9251 [Hortaea werneckii]